MLYPDGRRSADEDGLLRQLREIYTPAFNQFPVVHRDLGRLHYRHADRRGVLCRGKFEREVAHVAAFMPDIEHVPAKKSAIADAGVVKNEERRIGDFNDSAERI